MRSRKLFPAEREIIERHPNNFAGAVLDVAIGAGRTTSVLTRLSRDYVGIDYSEPMVNAARPVVRPEAEPRSQLYTLNMCDIPRAFSRKRFDAILISYNGIDYIPWENRDVNDMGDNYGLVTTYVSRQAQIEKLNDFGYGHVDVVHPWLNHAYTAFNYFVCRPNKREPRRHCVGPRR
jgi:SAM-dependent methyltransferase